MDSIQFFKEDSNIDLRKLKKHKKWLASVAESYNYKIKELNYIFCSDEYLLKINIEYLGHDTYTDIITFDLRENLQETEGIEADIFISVERVEENAKRLDISSQNELARVMAHGLLHLIGFKDKEAADKKEMTGAENKALELFLS